MMMKLLSLTTFVVSVLVLLNNNVQAEDAAADNNNGYDVTPYSLQSGSCFRVKQISENDDDGNAYFYNGAYRAQFTRYTSFYLCNSNSGNSKSSSSASANPTSKCNMFVTDLPTFLETTVNFVDDYCTSCSAMCRRRQLQARHEDNRQLGDNQVTVDCNSCSKQCKSFNEAKNNDNSAVNYLQCQKSYNDGELQYYSAPQCGNPDLGQYVIIGQFYDEDCTIKLNSDEAGSKFGLSYSYEAFETLASTKIDCNVNQAICTELIDASVNCGYGESLSDTNSKLCRSAQQAAAVFTYYKKPLYAKFHLKALLIVIFVLTFIFSFLSYTYYVRHKREPSSSSHIDETDMDYKLSSGGGPTSPTSDLPVIN